MTFRTIQGIPFHVRSPALYEISGAAHRDSFIELCAVHFDGRAWQIEVLMKQGHSIHRGPFPSLQAAVGIISGQIVGAA